MRHVLFAATLLAACALSGCSREVTRQQVAEFIDQADDAARRRFAPEICALRGKDFVLRSTFHAQRARKPAELEMTRKLYCRQAGEFARLRQYRLERRSMDIDVATDRMSATVTAEYVETLPYYDGQPMTPDDFRQFQVVRSTDVSVVGREDGDLVFLSTTSDAHQSLIGKNEVDIPYE
jgi:hypothetical protein